MAREVLEETGVHIDRTSVRELAQYVATEAGAAPHTKSVFCARMVQQQAGDEEEEHKWLETDSLCFVSTRGAGAKETGGEQPTTAADLLYSRQRASLRVAGEADQYGVSALVCDNVVPLCLALALQASCSK